MTTRVRPQRWAELIRRVFAVGTAHYTRAPRGFLAFTEMPEI